MENFTPHFKEKDKEQYYFEDNKWIKCNESKIVSLWQDWVCSKFAKKYEDKDGFLIFGFNNI